MIDPDAEIFSKYAYLWDGSDPGWTVDGHIEDRAHVRILLPENGIDARFLNVLRRTFPQLAHDAPSALRSRLEATGGFDCGTMDGTSAYALRRKCLAAGLRFNSEDRTLIRYFFINEQRNAVLFIDDAKLAIRVGAEAIRRGLPSRVSTT
jgi:hypothetical protein